MPLLLGQYPTIIMYVRYFKKKKEKIGEYNKKEEREKKVMPAVVNQRLSSFNEFQKVLYYNL